MRPPVQTIEKTSKSIKLWILLSTLGIIVGLWKGFAATDLAQPLRIAGRHREREADAPKVSKWPKFKTATAADAKKAAQ